jgi:hypothetical protein
VPDPSDETLERARTLAPRIAESADEIERQRRLPEPLVAALHDAGLFRLLLPRSLGGAELDPPTFVQVTETLARADASTAWVICQTNGCSMVAAYLAPEVARAMFGGDPGGVLAWGPPSSSRAVVADGGYRLSGTFNFASGSRHATWLGGQAPIVEPDGTPRRRHGAPERRTLLFPARDAELADVWHVIGLRGTGSDSFTVSDLVAGLLAHSTALLADGVDMLGDALVYGFSLCVVARGPVWHARGALLKGAVMAAFGVGILLEVAAKLARWPRAGGPDHVRGGPPRPRRQRRHPARPLAPARRRPQHALGLAVLAQRRRGQRRRAARRRRRRPDRLGLARHPGRSGDRHAVRDVGRRRPPRRHPRPPRPRPRRRALRLAPTMVTRRDDAGAAREATGK